MRFLACLRKSFVENLREWKVLSLALVFAPAFVFMMKGYYAAAVPAYRLQVVHHDVDATGAARPTATAARLVEAWRTASHADGQPMFVVEQGGGVAAARGRVARRELDLVVEIPADFEQDLARLAVDPTTPPPRLTNHADPRDLRGGMAMALSDYVAFSHLAATTGARLPLDVAVQAVGAGRGLGEFDLYVPALLVLAVIMILFTAATALVKEIDRGTLTRLALSRLRAGEFLAAVAVNQVGLGLVALGLAYLAALASGYRGSGSMVALLVVGAAASLAVVAIAVLISAFLRTMFALLTVGTFPFFILMFFSECMFPLPRIEVARLAGHALHLNDVLPTTLCVRAFAKVLNHGAGLGEVGFELAAILVLTAIYFALGGWLFHRRHLRIR